MDAWTVVVVKGYMWNNEVGEEEMVLHGWKELECQTYSAELFRNRKLENGIFK